MKGRIVIGGSAVDPCLLRLADEARAMGHEVIDATVRGGSTRRFHWRMDDASAILDDQPLTVDAAFLREAAPTTSEKMLTTFSGMLYAWVLSNPHVAFLNRFRSARVASGLALLPLAQACGLRVPKTAVSLAPPNDDGGEDNGPASVPVIVQERLVAPELRVFVVGDETIGFRVEPLPSNGAAARPPLLAPVEVPPRLVDPLLSLVQALGLDYGAASLKTCPDSGEPVFLDFDAAPLFARFDRLSGGAISQAILRELFDPERSERPTLPPLSIPAPSISPA